MDLKTIRLLHDYNRWVNERLLATVHQVPADRLTEKLGASFDSIHGTLAHMLGAGYLRPGVRYTTAHEDNTDLGGALAKRLFGLAAACSTA